MKPLDAYRHTMKYAAEFGLIRERSLAERRRWTVAAWVAMAFAMGALAGIVAVALVR